MGTCCCLVAPRCRTSTGDASAAVIAPVHSWLRSLRPKPYTEPAAVDTSVKWRPATTLTTVPTTPSTAVGSSRTSKSPCPSCPNSLPPHVNRFHVASSVTAQKCASPHAMSSTERLRSTGKRTGDLGSWSSCSSASSSFPSDTRVFFAAFPLACAKWGSSGSVSDHVSSALYRVSIKAVCSVATIFFTTCGCTVLMTFIKGVAGSPRRGDDLVGLSPPPVSPRRFFVISCNSFAAVPGT
mmetsp:Transcript_14379/g.45909  ORF Transcript_14379/g.45909 Transcript_14379/m.45909 type:complete len:239 (-) Transcript_14379:36-752(-)